MGDGAGFTLGQLAAALGATLDGDPSRVVTGVAPLERADPTQLSFLTDPRYREAALTSRAGAFLAPAEVSGLPAPTLRCPSPRLALAQVLSLFHPPTTLTPGIDRSAVIAPGARVAPTASVGALVVVESGAVIDADVQVHPLVYVGAGARVGEGSVLYPHVVIRPGVQIGRRVIVHPGAVLGADGFGYVHDGTGHRKIPQVGGVRIEDDVEIGANTTIDRAMLGETIVGRGTKIDNLVQVGHNVEIGEHCLLIAQVGISGTSRLGRGVTLAGQVGVADHVSIGDGALIGAQSGIHTDIAAGERILGTPARPSTQAKRIFLLEGELPELMRRVRALERRLAQMEARGAGAAEKGDRHGA